MKKSAETVLMEILNVINEDLTVEENEYDNYEYYYNELDADKKMEISLNRIQVLTKIRDIIMNSIG